MQKRFINQLNDIKCINFNIDNYLKQHVPKKAAPKLFLTLFQVLKKWCHTETIFLSESLFYHLECGIWQMWAFTRHIGSNERYHCIMGNAWSSIFWSFNKTLDSHKNQDDATSHNYTGPHIHEENVSKSVYGTENYGSSWSLRSFIKPNICSRV